MLIVSLDAEAASFLQWAGDTGNENLPNLDDDMAFREIRAQVERFADVIHPFDRVRDRIDDLLKWTDPVESWICLIASLYL